MLMGQAYCFICGKRGKGWNFRIRETMKDWEAFPKSCEPKGQCGAGGGQVGRRGVSKEAAEKYLWHWREEPAMSTEGNHDYEFQGIKTLSTQLIPTDADWMRLRWPNKCPVQTVSASSRPICPHITHSAGPVARHPDWESTTSVPQPGEG